MITKIGFTGPRTGMDERELDMLESLLRLLASKKPDSHSTMEFFHGDCVGADEQAHDLARRLGWFRITAFPPSNPALRAFCKADEVLPTKDYLERDRDLVDLSDLLISALHGPPRHGSGSWYTYNYAMKGYKRAWRL